MAGISAPALTRRLAQSADAAAIVALMDHREWSLIHCATALHRLAKLPRQIAPPQLVARTHSLLQGGGANSRTLTSIAWASWKLDLPVEVVLAVATHAAALLPSLDDFAVSNVAMALAGCRQRRLLSPHREAIAPLLRHAGSRVDRMARAELLNVLWAASAFALPESRALLVSASRRLGPMLADMSLDNTSRLLDAYARAGVQDMRMGECASRRLCALVAEGGVLGGKTLSTACAALAAMGTLGGDVHAAVAQGLASGNVDLSCLEDTTRLLWAISRAAEADKFVAAQHHLVDLITAAGDDLPFAAVVDIFGALGRMGQGPARLLARATLRREVTLRAVPQMSASHLGIVGAALARPLVAASIGSEGREAWSCALGDHGIARGCRLNSKSIAHMHMATLTLQGRRCDEALARALRRAIRVEGKRRDVINHLPALRLVAQLPAVLAAWKVRAGDAVLLVDDVHRDVDGAGDGILAEGLVRSGLTVHRWNRFVCAGTGAHSAGPWPPTAVVEQGCAFAVVRWPWYAAGPAARLLFHAVAAATVVGARIVVAGRADEGATSCAEELRATGLFHECSALSSAGADEVIVQAVRTPRASAGALRQFAGYGPPSSSPGPWRVFPGLFNGGVADDMTLALLEALPEVGGPVLDFACGSGVIAAELVRRAPTVRVDLLDADAVALAAACDNVPSAKKAYLSDGWPRRAMRRRRYACIVSNPPVHRGRPSDLSLVVDLVRGAARRLRRGGSLWVVAQRQVPVGLVMMACRPKLFSEVLQHGAADRPFGVWEARTPATQQARCTPLRPQAARAGAAASRPNPARPRGGPGECGLPPAVTVADTRP